MKRYKSLFLAITFFSLFNLLFAKDNLPSSQLPKETRAAMIKSKQAINKNYYAKPSVQPCASSPTDATITCYPIPANYETGSCLHDARSQTSLAYGNNGVDSTLDHGWFVFDISMIPDASVINSVELHAFCSGCNDPYWSITPISWTDPRTSPVADVYTDISEFDWDGYYYFTTNRPVSGWNVINLGIRAAADLRDKLSSDWWACGVDDIDNYSYYWIEFEGWHEAHVPYIVVNYSVIDYDVSPRRIVSPAGLIPAGPTLVKVMVQNLGGLNVGEFNARFTIGSYTDVQTVPGLVSCESAMVTFADWNAASGVYLAKCSTEYVLDENNLNDKQELSIIVAHSIEDFEPDLGGYYTDPPTNSWEWGTPTAGPTSTHSGVKCWATRLAGNYENNADWRLISNDFKASSDNPTICFYDWWSTENCYDGYQVIYSTDDGTTWNLLFPVGGYNYESVVGLGYTQGFSGNQPFWQLKMVVVPVANNSTFRLGWRFGSDYSVHNFPGIFIDDVAGVNCLPFMPVNDVGCKKIQAPTGIIDSGSVVIPACSVYNYGKAPVDYSVRMKIDNFYNEIGSVINHTPGTYRQVQFPAWNANQLGFYTVSCSTELYADEQTSNDQRTDSARVINPLAIKMEENLNSIKPFSLKIFPNPANGVIRIRGPLAEKAIKIFDISGKLVKVEEKVTTPQGRKQEVRISLKGINPGIYFLQLDKEIKKSLVVK